MSTQTRDYPEDIIYNFLKDNYVAYRTALTDPNVLPLNTDILWGAPKSELIPNSFVVVRLQTSRQYPFLGVSAVKYQALVTVRFATTWTLAGKPTILNEFEEFIDYEISKNQTATYFKNLGIDFVQVGTSSVVEPRDPELDQWVLNVQIFVNYMKRFT